MFRSIDKDVDGLSLPVRTKVVIDIDNERNRQGEMWGVQRHDWGTWLIILMEEVGEVAQAMQKDKNWGKESDASNLYNELIHVAAVATAMAEQAREINGY